MAKKTKKVQKFEIDGKKYLGTREGSVITGLIGDYSYATFLEEKAKGNLRKIEVGNPDKLIVIDYTPEQKLDNKRVKSLWKLAEKKTQAHVTCQIFNQLLGK